MVYWQKYVFSIQFISKLKKKMSKSAISNNSALFIEPIACYWAATDSTVSENEIKIYHWQLLDFCPVRKLYV